eukprot:scaffold1739_cov109-Cylindrotheca_fusiformis.AAC.5
MRFVGTLSILAILMYQSFRLAVVTDRSISNNDSSIYHSSENAAFNIIGLQQGGIEKNYSSNTVPFAQEMEERGLLLSLRQQLKFYSRKEDFDTINNDDSSIFAKEMMYTLDWNRWHTFLLNEKFAFRHIFKNGGTTVEHQIGAKQVRKKDIGKNRTSITVVRDPIDHFLSGWQECGERFPSYMMTSKRKSFDSEYNGRIQKWLERVRFLALGGQKACGPSMECLCALHSLPQANFLITEDRRIDPAIRLVGDLRELPKLLEMVHLIANDTMRELCEFLSLDYFLFDFERPEPCKARK